MHHEVRQSPSPAPSSPLLSITDSTLPLSPFRGGQGGCAPLREPIKLFFRKNRGDIIQKKKKRKRFPAEKEY